MRVFYQTCVAFCINTHINNNTKICTVKDCNIGSMHKLIYIKCNIMQQLELKVNSYLHGTVIFPHPITIVLLRNPVIHRQWLWRWCHSLLRRFYKYVYLESRLGDDNWNKMKRTVSYFPQIWHLIWYSENLD